MSRTFAIPRLHGLHRRPTLPKFSLNNAARAPFKNSSQTNARLSRSRHESDPRMRNTRINQRIMRVLLGAGFAIYGAWNFTEAGLLYKMYDKFQREQGPAFASATGIALPSAPPTRRLSALLHKFFVIRASEPNNVPAWFGASLSHTSFTHALFNLLTWSSFAPMLYPLAPVHTLALLAGSAAAGATAWLGAQRGKPHPERRAALGSSAVVSGVLAVCTMFAPLQRATLFFVVPMPLALLTGAYFAADTYLMASEDRTGIGHAGHLGGGVFGVLYYVVFLRRYGGILAGFR